MLLILAKWHMRWPPAGMMLISYSQQHNFGLQLVLLIELGYSDLVITANEGWKSYVEINKFLMEAND